MTAKFEVFPHGISIGPSKYRPAMIFKDKKEKEVLPVWLDTVDASLLLASAQGIQDAKRAHNAIFKVFEGLKINLKSIYFNEISAATQYALLTAVQGKKTLEIRVRAGEAMSLAVNAGCVFYTDQNVIEKSRVLNLEWLNNSNPRAGNQGSFEGLH
jgi:bifunctional DNase/RNase